VQPPLPARLELEMLDRIGHVNAPAIDAGLLERLVQKKPGGSHERAAGEILAISRLLADQHEGGAARAFAGHRLRGVAIERAARAASFGCGELLQRFDRT